MTTTNSKQKGFTIIEVVLVLAIAGLIFLIVFLALPALQRNQRDTARRNDVGRAVAAVQSYQSNMNGSVPTLAEANGTLKTSYLKAGGSSFADPNGGDYTFVAGTFDATTNAPTGPTTIGQMGYTPNRTCSGAGSARQVAITVPLEGGGIYCANN